MKTSVAWLPPLLMIVSVMCASSLSGYEGTPSDEYLDGLVFHGTLRKKGDKEGEPCTIRCDKRRVSCSWLSKIGFPAAAWAAPGEISGDKDHEYMFFTVTFKNEAGGQCLIQGRAEDQKNLTATYRLTKRLFQNLLFRLGQSFRAHRMDAARSWKAWKCRPDFS